MLELRFAKRWAAPGWLLLAAAAAGGCVAQEPYHQPAEEGGSGGKPPGSAAAGKGGLELAAGASAGTDAGGSATEPSGDVCLSSAQCAKPNPYCLAATGRCVECLSQRNCVGTGFTYCDSRTYTCVACLNDTQCAHERPYCAGNLGQCVECLSTDNCGDTGLLCDRRGFRCVPSCSSHADCAASVLTPFCDPETSLCVACLADDACTAPTSRCSPDTRSCVQCVDSGDCQPGVACVAGACVNPK